MRYFVVLRTKNYNIGNQDTMAVFCASWEKKAKASRHIYILLPSIKAIHAAKLTAMDLLRNWRTQQSGPKVSNFNARKRLNKTLKQ